MLAVLDSLFSCIELQIHKVLAGSWLAYCSIGQSVIYMMLVL